MPVPIPPASGNATTTVARARTAEPSPPVGTPTRQGAQHGNSTTGHTDGSTPNQAAAKPLTTDTFAKAVNHSLDAVSGREYSADAGAAEAATGEIASTSDLRITNVEAETSTEMTVAIRNRAVAAFNEILAMQM
jgi:flagellar hook-basal body complex protein FliE